MEYLTLIGTVTIIHLLALISPGPDFIVAVKNSLTYSRKVGVYTALGFGLGITIHLFYCVGGLAILISQSIIIFNILKLLGAGYLIFIGLKTIISKSSTVKFNNTSNTSEISALKAIEIGFLTNVLNPKATLSLLSLFTIVISPDTPNYILAILCAIMIFSTIIWFTLVSIFFTQKRIITAYNKIQGVFNKVLGGLLIGLGITVALR
jgi:RhtB (resistance to homoserine/threonine) family protein